MDTKASTINYKRVDISLPKKTVELIDRVIPKGKRSRFINDAVQRRLQEVGQSNLRRELEAGYKRDFEEDKKTAQDWFAVDEEAWQEARL